MPPKKTEMFFVLVGTEDDIEEFHYAFEDCSKSAGPFTLYPCHLAMSACSELQSCVTKHRKCHGVFLKESYCRGKEDQSVILKRRLKDTYPDVPVICWGKVDKGGKKRVDYDYGMEWSEEAGLSPIIQTVQKLRSGQIVSAANVGKAPAPLEEPAQQKKQPPSKSHSGLPASGGQSPIQLQMPNMGGMGYNNSMAASMGSPHTMFGSPSMMGMPSMMGGMTSMSPMMPTHQPSFNGHVSSPGTFGSMTEMSGGSMMSNMGVGGQHATLSGGLMGGQLQATGFMNTWNNNMSPQSSFPAMQQQQQQQVPAPSSGAVGLVAALMDELKHLRVLVEEKRVREAAAVQ
ncbi:hypothetical protein CEUSTIGMA_g2541.t1 [Chlamydomonas eustigma]|uniref:Uncharacterized protein n=1 Tax=Chlamydomonas eustigma TaxID=1157962 RepID=A0A250WW88_9CHLO|nr:hypothetical protein CEUSTIGMA_g2541.t1 [Chlamydomonas eustigma]|eukprot:GAX75097.1 hypothetical protein CEUSTIGMA_g2541.t1 [Chlamydomonas eustigma]